MSLVQTQAMCYQIPEIRKKRLKHEDDFNHASLKAITEVKNKTKNEEGIFVYHEYLDDTTIILCAYSGTVHSRCYLVAQPSAID